MRLAWPCRVAVALPTPSGPKGSSGNRGCRVPGTQTSDKRKPKGFLVQIWQGQNQYVILPLLFFCDVGACQAERSGKTGIVLLK